MDEKKDSIDIGNILSEINEAFYNIPFENSDYQTQNIVISGSITPERAYRTIGLRLMTKLNEVRETMGSIEKTKIEIERNNRKIRKLNEEKPDDYDLDVRILEIDNINSEQSLIFTKKLLNDSTREINLLYKNFSELPKFTREQFESKEEEYFLETQTDKLLGIDGPASTLKHMLGMRDSKDVKELFEGAINKIKDTNLLKQLKE